MGFLLLMEYSIFPVRLILLVLQLFKTVIHILLYKNIWTNSHSLKIQQMSHKYFLTSRAVITAKTTPLAK